MTSFGSFALALLCVAGAMPSARGQTSLYAVGGIANYGFQNRVPGEIEYKGFTGDVGGGAFYNFPIDSRVTVGVDGRALFSPGDKGGYNAGAALRVGFVPHRNPLRPFFQIGGGVVHSFYDDVFSEYGQNGALTVVTTRHNVTTGAAQIIFGLDIRLTRRMDLRAPEYGAQAGGGSAGVAFLNGGLVYHLGR